MTFYGTNVTQLELLCFSFVASTSLVIFFLTTALSRVKMRRQVLVLLPLAALFLMYQNILLSLADEIDRYSALVYIGGIFEAAIIPFMLSYTFELAYVLHKHRFLQFFGIEFKKGHRNQLSIISWILRSIIHLISIVFIALKITINVSRIKTNEQINRDGFRSFYNQENTKKLMITVLPPIFLFVFGTYFSFQLWRYGSQSSLIINVSYFNRWVVVFFGSIVFFTLQFSSSKYYAALSNLGLLFYCFCLLLMLQEVTLELLEVDDFVKYLEGSFQDEKKEKEIASDRLIEMQGVIKCL